jgi:predicted phage terminase large subunit-like protein
MKIIGPASKKQELYINATQDVVVFGGGAGSGKSFLGAMDMLKYTNDPKFRGLVVRRLTPQIHGPGGIFETFVNLHREVYEDKLKIKKRDGIIEYPSGANISFRHCQYEEDKHSFQGWQISYALLDEGQQLTESMVIYIMSRLRTEANMKPKLRLTCNPAGKGHWLTNWLEWYLLPTGLPDPEKCGKTRWFTMRDNEMVWSETKEELQSKIPGCNPLSFTFISANVYDNPVLMKRQPEYVAWLEGLNREDKEALLYGNWYVTKQFEGYFKRKWTPIISEPPYFARRVRGFDLAGSVVDEVNKDPDYTATVLISKTKNGKYCIEHAHRMRERFHTVEEFILNLARNEPEDITYVIPVDAGAAGKAYARSLQQKIAETGRHVVLHPTGNKSKLVRFRPFASVCQSGAVEVLSGAWNDWFFDELEQFVGDGKQHDDALDAAVSAFWYLNQGMEIPTIIAPTDLSVSAPFTLEASFDIPQSGLVLEKTI